MKKKILTGILFAIVLILFIWGVIELMGLLPYAFQKWYVIPIWYKPIHLIILMGVQILTGCISYWWATLWFIINKPKRKPTPDFKKVSSNWEDRLNSFKENYK